MTSAKLTVTQGTERGRVFVLNGEIAHIGRAAENQIVLSDPDLAEHQACIANRHGRFAIYVSGEKPLEVNGQPLPAQQWIWLPAEASLQFTPRTVLQFENGTNAGDRHPVSATATPAAPSETDSTATPRKSERRRSAKKAESPGRVVAKFITDRPGETLVRLGADGQLPELSLTEGGVRRKAGQASASKGSPVLLYAALGFSVLASVALLMLEPASSSGTSQSAARRTILREFVGQENQPLQPFQKLLREAELAHSRGDRREELQAYQAVLRLLNSEDRNPLTGVTGHVEDDERLRKLLAILMGPG